jgi:hypothetical protein
MSIIFFPNFKINGYEPACDILERATNQIIREWTNRKYLAFWKTTRVQKYAEGFLQEPSAGEVGTKNEMGTCRGK